MTGQDQGETDVRKQDVEIVITSKSSGQTMRQIIRGTAYPKGDRCVYRYPEPGEEMGRTITLLKVERDAIRILRQGDVQSEQTFAYGRTTAGFYSMPQGRLPLEIKTRKLSVRLLPDSSGSLAWTYDLSAGGEVAGRFSIGIDIRPLAAGHEDQER